MFRNTIVAPYLEADEPMEGARLKFFNAVDALADKVLQDFLNKKKPIIRSAGTSEGAKKAWESRDRGKGGVKETAIGESWTKISGPKGTNPGGIYENAEGVRYYAKQYSNQDQGKTEVVANRLYRELGIPVPESFETKVGGKESVAARMLPDAKQLSSDEFKSSPDLAKGFVVDAWLANHDVIGLEQDNVMRSGGKDYRIDNGGAMFYRAQGAHKTFFEDHPNDVPEIDSMRNPAKAQQAGSVFKRLTDDDLKPQAKHLVETMTDAKITSIVKEGRFKPATEKRVTEYLIGRRDGIAKRFGL